jgi:hypothetical protein
LQTIRGKIRQGRTRGLIGAITTPQIDNFLKGLGGKARSKNNCRDAIIAFFSFAQQKGFIPYSLPHAAENTTEFRDVREKIETEARAIELMEPNDIYLPHEMRKLLETAKQYELAVLPSLEIKAFSGVRTEEMIRLWWVMVCEKQELIRIPDAIGKIDARRPRSAVVKPWLLHYTRVATNCQQSVMFPGLSPLEMLPVPVLAFTF